MIRRTLRFGIRLGLFAGIGLALFKLIQGRRSASEYGSPSADWAPPPAPNPNLPRTPPEPELIKPAMLEEVIEKKAAVRAVPTDLGATDISPAPPVETFGAEQPVQKASPVKRAAAKKVPTAAEPAAAGPVKKVAPPRKAAAKKVAPPIAAPPVDAPPVAKKAAPVKKAVKKQP